MKVPEPRKLPSGNYNIRMRLQGESISITRRTAKECKREAELIKAEFRAEKRNASTAGAMTLSQAIEQYCENKKALSPATVRGYYAIKNNRFKSVMDHPIKSISNWQKLINDEAREVSPKTVANAWGLIRSVLEYYEVKVPNIMLPTVIENDMPWLEPEDLKKFVAAVAGHKYEIEMLLAIHSLRRSEIIALEWKNVDLKNGIIYVEGAAVYDKDYKLVYKKENKTRKSRRPVVIMIPSLIRAMEAVEDKTGRVARCYPDTIYRNINRICKEIGLERVGCHGLRRSFASLAYELGWSERHTQETGGWSNAQTMHKFYIKLSQRQKNEDTEKMAAFFSEEK